MTVGEYNAAALRLRWAWEGWQRRERRMRALMAMGRRAPPVFWFRAGLHAGDWYMAYNRRARHLRALHVIGRPALSVVQSAPAN